MIFIDGETWPLRFTVPEQKIISTQHGVRRFPTVPHIMASHCPVGPTGRIKSRSIDFTLKTRYAFKSLSWLQLNMDMQIVVMTIIPAPLTGINWSHINPFRSFHR